MLVATKTALGGGLYNDLGQILSKSCDQIYAGNMRSSKAPKISSGVP